jgi:hypothetical protein
MVVANAIFDENIDTEVNVHKHCMLVILVMLTYIS